jgi:hypothetical protein
MVIQFQFDVSDSVIVFFHFFKLFSFSSSFCLLSMSVKIWKIIAIQKMSTKTALMLFIEIAILSGDSQSHQFVHPVNEKIKVKNWCQNHGILLAMVFHR